MPRIQIIAISVLAAAAAAAYAFWPHQSEAKPIAPQAAAAAAPRAVKPFELTLASALQEKRIRLEATGNGKDKLALIIHNAGAEPLRLHLAAGQLFSSAKSTVALARSLDLEIQPNARKAEDVKTVATTSVKAAGEAEAFTFSTAKLPQLELLFVYLDQHPELPLAAAQVATLSLTENLPVAAFARFVVPEGGASSLDTKAFKADTSDIIAALIALRDASLDRQLALTIDPQLKIEAMIDPLAHALALHYYGIADEWGFWKNELLTGAAATRHYALYGIARFYPEIALQMLPKWARAAQMNPVYRLSAIQALAETQRPEALTILRQLELDLGSTTELGKTAHAAASYLDRQFTKAPAKDIHVAFRADAVPAIAAAN